MKPFHLSRRTFLQGLGAAVALPTLEAMLDSNGTALAAGTPLPRRFATFFFGDGVILDKWTPAGTGANWQLSPALAPLVNVKSYVNVVSGHQVKTPNRRGHHNGQAGILSGYPFIELSAPTANYASKFGGPSIDQVAASTIGQGTTFRSLELGVSKRIVAGEGPTLQYISHKGPDQPMQPEYNPAALFTRLFGSFSSSQQLDPRAALRANVLDAVRGDAKRLQDRLGSADRARLDAHLTSISELRQQILALPPQYTSACVKPQTVTQTNSDSEGKEPLEEVSKAMSDLLVMAWACDLTRVASYMFSGGVCDTVFHMLGQNRGNHDLTHDPSAQDQVHDAVVWTVKQFAYLLERLKATPEAGGNLLDNSCLLFTSDVAEGIAHSITDYPLLVAGRAGGYLKSTGIHVRSTSNENTSNVLLTCLKAVGTGVTSVGGSEGYSDTECTALKA
ncbi:DUF1552 domain-containing protein [Vitiosangium sp. GDMCC 1.1324]|uniref:DUF1552 domain-containing protein n=1 Tax=Vitiosangium sp. (strain GDMCC 1.1324) TaxID=2138576 RepID=UPI000D3CDDBB|nr:DUF1552 domain-containing protein [Vitiosangium sp. GDMCC 1.1324]PTL85545.1 hypothetical protein DAT35_02175 [Vitiosangium sp. GDMCC 1.1324]